MSKRKKQKRNFIYLYWINYFKNNTILTRGSWPTIGHALADFILKDESKSKRYKQLEKIACALNRQRSDAVRRMKKDGMKICVTGSKTHVEQISTNEADQDEHDERQIRRGRHTVFSVETNLFDVDDTTRLEKGWIPEETIDTMQKRLTEGERP